VDHKDIPVVPVFRQIQEITVREVVVAPEVLEPQVMLLLVDMVVLVFNFLQHSEIPYQEWVLLVLGVEIIGLLVEVQVKILDLAKILEEVLVDHMRVEEIVLHPPIHLLQLDILDQPILAEVVEEVMLLTQLCAAVLAVPE
jgi:hypothetical protein